MKAYNFTLNNFNYIFDNARKGAKYSLNGGLNWCNSGEFIESAIKFCFGYDAKKDANTPFDKGSDIEKINASVKSSKATLVNKVLGSNYNEVKKVYFNQVHSSLWLYGIVIDNELTVYEMNKIEFEMFLDNWSTFDKERQVIRIKNTSAKMIQWFENRVN